MPLFITGVCAVIKFFC